MMSIFLMRFISSGCMALAVFHLVPFVVMLVYGLQTVVVLAWAGVVWTGTGNS